MNVREILMRGFMSHTKTELTLPERGLVVVTGPNGSGKSSLVEGASFGGWGESLRGTPPWGEAPGELVVVSDVVRVVRAFKSGKKKVSWCRIGEEPVKYENATKAEEALEAVIGPHDVWRRTHVFSSHDAAHFTMASDGERKRLLECILGLHRFDEALDLCRADRRKEELNQASVLTRVQQLRAHLTTARDRLADAEKFWAAAPAEVDGAELSKKLKVLDAKVQQATADHLAAGEQVRALERLLDTRTSQVRECERWCAMLESEKQTLVVKLAARAQMEADAKGVEATRAQLETLDAQILELRQKRDLQNAELMRWQEKASFAKLAYERARLDLASVEKAAAGLGSVPCDGQGEFASCRLIAGATEAKAKLPALHQAVEAAGAAVRALGDAPVVSPFDETGAMSQRKDLSGKLTEAGRALAGLDALEAAAARVRVIDDEVAVGMQTAAVKRREGAELEDSLGLQRGMLEELQEECDTLRQRKAEVEANLKASEAAARQRQVVKDGVDRATAALAQVEADLAKDEGEAAGISRRLGVLEAVEQVLGLKGVRAHVLGGALGGIEMAANSWLLRFGLAMSLELKPYTEKKTGGVSDAISLIINGAGGGYGYKGASGGQRRRIDVALLLALADVASAAQGRAPGTLFLDEVFDALDDEGVESVCGVLGGLAQERAVVVITHNQALISKLPADMRIEVKDGSVTCRQMRPVQSV